MLRCSDVDKTACLNGLYIVATPIGDPTDLSLRALEILKRVALIACEDTRIMGKLLNFHQIKTPLLSYHDHSGALKRSSLKSRLIQGEAIALTSDGGTPLISDPGYKLVQECLKCGLPVHAVPGPCAFIVALCLFGLPPDKFFFQGFLPAHEQGRQRALQKIASLPATLIFYEAPHRLLACLETMEKILGNRQAAVARELTKTFENVQRDTLKNLITFYKEQPPRGQIVIGVHGLCDAPLTQEELLRACQEHWPCQAENMSVRCIVQYLAGQINSPKSSIYRMVLRLSHRI